MLGVAGGTVARAYAKYFPDTVIDAVEIDGELFDIGRRWFGLEDRPQLRVHADDARPFLRKTDERYDFIFLDTYRQPYIPFYLATKEFFELAHDRLAPGRRGDHQRRAIPRAPSSSSRCSPPRWARRSATSRAIPVTDTNTLLMGSDAQPSRDRLRAAARTMPAELRRVALADASRLAPPLAGGEVYTDDKAPVEWLVDKSLIDYAGGGVSGLPHGAAAAPRRTAAEAVAVWRACELHDDGEALATEDDLVAVFQRPSFDAARAHASRSATAARSSRSRCCTDRATRSSCVLPGHRGRGIGTWLLGWTQEAGRALRARRDLPGGHRARARRRTRCCAPRGYEARWESWMFEIALDARAGAAGRRRTATRCARSCRGRTTAPCTT